MKEKAMEKRPDSLVHHEQRRAKMQTEAQAQAQEEAFADEQRAEDQVEREHKTREAEDKLLVQYTGPISPTDTRDDLLDRIRAMRNEKPPEIKPLGRTPDQQKQFEAEQKAGREAVARAEAEEERLRPIREAARAEGEKNKRQDGAGFPAQPFDK
jgi:hypothetical protein